MDWIRWGGAAVLVWFVAGAGCQRLEEDGPSGNDDDDAGGGTFMEATGTPVTEGNGSDPSEGDTSECNPVTQTGCPGDEKCTATVGGGSVSYRCVDDTPSLNPEESCTPNLSSGQDGCPAGYACLGDVSGAGLCVALCENDSDCTQAVCIPDAVQSVPYCASECSPFEPSCPAPLQCRRDGQRFACKFVQGGDVGVTGDPCNVADDGGCGGGFVCVPGALVPGCTFDNCCTNVCELGGMDPCPSPSICSALLTSPAPGFEQVGACFVPAQ